MRFEPRGARHGILAMALLVSATALGGEAMTLRGKGSYTAIKTPMPLGNGQTVVLMTNRGVGSMAAENSASAPDLVQFNCAAMGTLSKENQFGFDVYCSMAASETDVLDLKGSGNSELVNMTVIGGSGRWKGASGSGTIKPQKQGNNHGMFAYEFRVTTP